MKYRLTSTVFSCTILFTLTIGTACNKNKRTLVVNAYAVDNQNRLISFNLNEPGFTAGIKITNLQPGESIVGLDIRPDNEVMYGLGSSNHLYYIDKETGVATRVNPVFTTALSGTSFGFDINPYTKEIRVISNTGQNLRVDPILGRMVIDGDINPAGLGISACAYSNNVNGALTTELYAIGSTTNMLYKVYPNSGVVIDVGPLGVDVDADIGFDIAGVNKGYALVTTDRYSKLYSVNLSTGALTDLGKFWTSPTGTDKITSLAVIP